MTTVTFFSNLPRERLPVDTFTSFIKMQYNSELRVVYMKFPSSLHAFINATRATSGIYFFDKNLPLLYKRSLRLRGLSNVAYSIVRRNKHAISVCGHNRTDHINITLHQQKGTFEYSRF